jgi:hypothetical protein
MLANVRPIALMMGVAGFCWVTAPQMPTLFMLLIGTVVMVAIELIIQRKQT